MRKLKLRGVYTRESQYQEVIRKFLQREKVQPTIPQTSVNIKKKRENRLLENAKLAYAAPVRTGRGDTNT